MDPAALGLDLVLLAFLGGLMGLDRRGAFQMMVSQPVVWMPLLSLCFGDLSTGLQLGAFLQLLWMSSSLFGANVPPNETLASAVIGGLVFLAPRHGFVDLPAPQLWAASILLGAPFCFAGRWLEMYIDKTNLRLARRADQAARALRPRRLEWQVWRGLARTFALNAGLIVVGTLLMGMLLTVLAPLFQAKAPAAALTGIMVFVIPAVGIAVALSHLRRRMGLILAAVAFFVVLAALGPMVPK